MTSHKLSPRRMYRLLLLITTSAFLFAGCDAFEGPEGPQGPPGVANIESFEGSYTRNDVAIEEIVGTVAFDAPEITEEVYNEGSVQVYYELADEWMALPWTISSGSASVEMTYSYSAGRLSIIFISNNSTLPRDAIPEGRIKATIIPPAATDSEASTAAHKAENFSL